MSQPAMTTVELRNKQHPLPLVSWGSTELFPHVGLEMKKEVRVTKVEEWPRTKVHWCLEKVFVGKPGSGWEGGLTLRMDLCRSDQVGLSSDPDFSIKYNSWGTIDINLAEPLHPL